ncbi:tyrosine recombinase XerC [uncultured Massilia sp.]|uniref:site-specific integrase n=1 Tax=uncultured Massilia sp. TaxID=169973 RepID=UPI0025D1739E|nr:site-specific integrase [uncultured Massilia sp.]
MTTPPSLSAWDARPAEEFADFVVTAAFVETSSRQRGAVSLPISPESAAVYRFMFGKFAAWMLERGLRMSTVSSSDLKAFVLLSTRGKRDLNSKIAYRYLRLLERVFAYLGRDPNPARQAIVASDRDLMTQDAPMTALDAGQLQRFLAALPAARAEERASGANWKRRRDRAMQVVMALSGLRVAEAIGLLVDEVGRQADVDGAIELSITPEAKHRTSYEHSVVLPALGVAELFDWLKERADLGIPGSLAFPANMDGEPLHKATVYRQVRATFQRAGIPAAHAGGRTLRNTFAFQQLQQGTPQDALTTALGLALERSTEAYRHARVRPAQEDAGDAPQAPPPETP